MAAPKVVEDITAGDLNFALNCTEIFFTSKIPKINQLKYFLVEINFSENNYARFFSNFNRQKIIARRIIEISDDILAAPVEGNISQIHFIVPEEWDKRIALKELMENLNLSLIGSYRLHYVAYLECIRFTMNFKFSSEWNQIRNYFVKTEKLFSKINDTMESIQLNFLITDEALGIYLKVLNLKLPTLSLNDLGIDIATFYELGIAEVKQKIYTLPDLKMATAVNVCLKLPDSCPFKEYSDVREYWKTLYGYDLPESEEEMIYIEVIFDWSNLTYVYPVICVCPFELLQYKFKNNTFKIINEFFETWKRKFPKVCGHPLRMRMKNFLQTSNTCKASEVSTDTGTSIYNY